MNGTNEHAGLVLAAHPTSRGFGWVLFEGSEALVDWGIASAKEGRNAKLVARLERLLKRYDPAVFVLEGFEEDTARRNQRIQDLCRSMRNLAVSKGLRAPVYPRFAVQNHFAREGASTRHEIAQAVARCFDAIDHRLPRKRKIWESEDARQSLFDAAALALTHYAVTRTP